jgi:hypothetical protein
MLVSRITFAIRQRLKPTSWSPLKSISSSVRITNIVVQLYRLCDLCVDCLLHCTFWRADLLGDRLLSERRAMVSCHGQVANVAKPRGGTKVEHGTRLWAHTKCGRCTVHKMWALYTKCGRRTQTVGAHRLWEHTQFVGVLEDC